MKIITLVLSASAALFLSSCAGTKCASCCDTGSTTGTATKSCCTAAAAKGTTCKVCAEGKTHDGTKPDKKSM